jgi:16S rRNA processing protein RimM
MIVLGRIVAPFGIQGWVRISPYGDDPLTWADMPQWWMAQDPDAPAAEWKPVALRDCKEHGGGLIALFEAHQDRNLAESLKGWYVGAPRNVLPATGDNEYYWADLTGLSVENVDGEQLGKVAGLLSTGAHEVLRVVDGDTERLIPFVAAYALDVNLDQGLIRVDWQKDW